MILLEKNITIAMVYLKMVLGPLALPLVTAMNSQSCGHILG